PLGGYLAPDARDPALRGDQERRPLDAHEFPPVHGFLDPDVIGPGDLLVLVGGQAPGQLVLALELVVALRAVGRDADHDGAGALEGVAQDAELPGLDRAPLCIVLRIEIKHDSAAAEVLEREAPSVV